MRTLFLLPAAALLAVSCTPPDDVATDGADVGDGHVEETDEPEELDGDVTDALDDLAGTLDRFYTSLTGLQDDLAAEAATEHTEVLEQPLTVEIEQRIQVVNTRFDDVADLTRLDPSLRGVLHARLDDAGTQLAALQAQLETPIRDSDDDDDGPPDDITVIEEGDGDGDGDQLDADHGDGEPATPRELAAEREKAVADGIQQLEVYTGLLPLVEITFILDQLHQVDDELTALTARFARLTQRPDNSPDVRYGLENLTERLATASERAHLATLDIGAALLTADGPGPAFNTALEELDATVEVYQTQQRRIAVHRDDLLQLTAP